MTSLLRNKSSELIILSEHFAPSTGATAQLVTDLVEDLYRKGVRLRVLTSTVQASESSFPIHQFSGSKSISIGVFGKVVDGLFFFWGSAIWLLANIGKDQSILIVSNPPFIGLIGLLLSIIKGTRYIFLFQDVFPRSASLTGILPAQGPLTFFWRSLLRAVLLRSQANVVLSQAMERRCRHDFGDKVRLVSIPNWAVFPSFSTTKEQSPLTSIWELASTFTIQYSGNFGRLHEILIILEAARLLLHQPIRFVFIGGGAKAAQIHRYCNAFGLTNVLIKPYQPRALLSDSLAACDLSIVSLIPGAEDTVAPSKLYGIMASSRPILLISNEDSELASIVINSQCGRVVPHGDVTLLSETIVHLKENPDLVTNMGKNSRRLYDEKYGRSRSTAEYYRLLDQHGMV